MGFLNKLIELSAEITKKQDQGARQRTVKNMIGFFGIKAGMGTSTIAANTAIVLASHDFNICVIDFDLHYPVQYRLLGCKQDKIASFAKLLINTTLDVPEIYNDTKLSTLKIISANPVDPPNRFFDMDPSALTRILSRTSELFDLVLIDFGGADIGYESTTTGLQMCNQLYTVITPNADILEGTFKIFNWLQELHITTSDVTIIQNMVIEDPIRTDKLKEFGFRHLMDLPMYSDIARLRYNDRLLIRSSIEGKSADVWRAGILALANTIQEFSSADNYTTHEETAAVALHDEVDAESYESETETDTSDITAPRVVTAAAITEMPPQEASEPEPALPAEPTAQSAPHRGPRIAKLHAPTGLSQPRAMTAPAETIVSAMPQPQIVSAEDLSPAPVDRMQPVKTVSLHAEDLYVTPPSDEAHVTQVDLRGTKKFISRVMGERREETEVASKLQDSAAELLREHHQRTMMAPAMNPQLHQPNPLSSGTPPQFSIVVDTSGELDLSKSVANLSGLEKMFAGVEESVTDALNVAPEIPDIGVVDQDNAAAQFDALLTKLT